ncbi:MAG: hypothetical protein U5K27_05210 [Desulfotignum sp.]|nr:hypothetical protein [Desulfotignum sp.]
MVLIAESDLNDPRVIRSPAVGGYGIHAQWNEDFHHALHAVLTGETQGYYQDFGSLAQLAKVLTRGLVYDGCYSTYRRRCHGRPATGILGTRFVGCLQNHDQVGNRALGERTSRLLSPGLLKIGAALVHDLCVCAHAVSRRRVGGVNAIFVFYRSPGTRTGRSGETRPAQRICRIRMGKRSDSRSPGTRNLCAVQAPLG